MTILWSPLGFVEAVKQVVPAGRRTTPPSLQQCRGWGAWIRCDVATWILLKPMAISAVRKRLLLPWYPDTCGWLLTPIFRLARGQAAVVYIAYHHIILFRHRRWGNSAKVRRGLRQHANPFEGHVTEIIDTSWRGEAPGAVPTLRQRGPWRPLWTGRQGRLPSWTASLRRGFPSYLTVYRNIDDTACQFLSVSAGTKEVPMGVGESTL